MSLFPCSSCHERKPGKFSSVTWAWWRADNVRTAHRQRLCVDCYIMNVAGLDSAAREEPLNCPSCHTDPDDQMDPTYVTSFIPGIGPVRLELATCAPCAVEVRNRALVGAVKLDDRPAEFGGQNPGPQTDSSLEVWRALGIAPRE
jgi:hypothetical protein